MRRANYIVLALSTAVIFGCAVAVLLSPEARAQVTTKVKSVTEVLIVNTTAEAVPVQGSVQVSNLGSETLSVRDVDGPGRQPVHASTSFAVPAGKRFVIEYISAEFRSTGPCSYVRFSLLSFPGGSPPSTVQHYYPPFVGTQDDGADYVYGFSNEVRAYIEGGNEVGMGSAFTCPTGSSVQQVRFSGYLIDVS